METKVNHDLEGQEFNILLGNDQAELTYAKPEEKVIDFQHTFVPEQYRNNGIADQLIQTGLQYAQQQQFRVIASCPFVAAYIRRHQEYQSLLKKPD
ncbi:MAG: GNAT family N-acetyltransferase [Adhaeribacter sp.]